MTSKLTSTSLDELKDHLTRLATDQIILICDSHIETLYAPLLQELRHLQSKTVLYWRGRSGESNKNFQDYEKCMNELTSKGVHRKAHLVALGGGALSDFAGFVAATLLRGLSWSVIPTTLLAQIDASIGGKTGINSSQGKNLIGSFHLPEHIFLCHEFLQTLEPHEYQSGQGELVKYALLSREIFEAVMGGKDLKQLVLMCAEFKQKVVAQDLHEQRERKYLNLGHTFGHAYEFLTKEPHGISVLWGIEYIDRVFLQEKFKDHRNALLDKLQLEPRFLSIKEDDLVEYLHRDKKKVSQDEIQLVLLEDIGRPYLKSYSLHQLGLS